MIAIDWSHTKNLTTYDGHKLRTETIKSLCNRIGKDGMGGESNGSIQSKGTLQPPDADLGGESIDRVQSIPHVQPPSAKNEAGESIVPVKSTGSVHPASVVIEQGCPLNLAYNLILAGANVFVISNRATEEYRKAHGIEKSDEIDVKIIYELATNGATLTPLNLDNKLIQMHDLYHQYCRYQKARVAMGNMRKAHLRHYRGWESEKAIESRRIFHQPLDLTPYDIAIDTLGAREKSLLKRLETTYKGLPLFEAGGESKLALQSTYHIQPPAIKGLGQRLWLGILVTANPQRFKCLSAYLQFCGLTDEVSKSHRYNRHARSLYRLLAESMLRARNEKYRAIYDQCKATIAKQHPDYTKGHCHNAALNRVATLLAKEIFGACR